MTQYRVNTPRFVAETVDGEALIMDMVKGTYFSCVGASTAAWHALKAGATEGDVAGKLAAAYGVEPARVAADVQRFVEALVADEVLVAVDPAAPGPAGVGAVDVEAIGDTYEPLELERYTDLADLILLDPVHDVTDAGWPTESPR